MILNRTTLQLQPPAPRGRRLPVPRRVRREWAKAPVQRCPSCGVPHRLTHHDPAYCAGMFGKRER